MHELAKAIPLFSHQIGLGNAHVFKRDLRRVAGANAHLPVNLVARHPFGVRRHDDQAEAVVLLLIGVGDALRDHEITYGAVRNEHFIAVDHVVGSVLDGPRLVARDIRSRIGFGVGAGAHLNALADRRQIGFFLLFRSVVEDGLAAEAGGHDIQADAHIDFGQFFRDDGIA